MVNDIDGTDMRTSVLLFVEDIDTNALRSFDKEGSTWLYHSLQANKDVDGLK